MRDQKHFKFLKSIPHKEVLHYHKISDIYVSANTDGNLINTNLEAIGSRQIFSAKNYIEAAGLLMALREGIAINSLNRPIYKVEKI